MYDNTVLSLFACVYDNKKICMTHTQNTNNSAPRICLVGCYRKEKQHHQQRKKLFTGTGTMLDTM